MSKCLSRATLALLTFLWTATALAQPLGLGREATPEEIAAWDIDVRPDGAGLPEGQGSVEDGEAAFSERCAVCHGDFGEGVDRWPVLAGGQDTLVSDRPVKTIGSYWPYLSTVWDYVHRAMPFGEAQSLSDDEVYAITAYLLYANDLVDDDFVLSRENFAEVRLPNEANFFMDDRDESPVFATRDVCMNDCKETVEITKRARVLDVTPDAEDAGDGELGGEEAALAPLEPATTMAKALDADLAGQGEKVFKKCRSCHQVGDGAKNKVGPRLNGIYGAPVATVEGFKYSTALVTKNEEGAHWDTGTLDAFLAKPKDWAKGTKMSFAGLRKEEDRQAVIEYLKSVSQ